MLTGLLGAVMGCGAVFAAVYVRRLIHAAFGCDTCFAFMEFRSIGRSRRRARHALRQGAA